MTQQSDLGKAKCTRCGAAVGSRICPYCGSLTTAVPPSEAEIQVLDEYHELLKSKGQTAQIRLLETGFLPTDPEVLVEAGLRCLPFIDDAEPVDEVAGAAARRLEAIVAKLRLTSSDGQTRQAVEMFRARVSKHKSAQRRFWVILAVAALVSLPCLSCLVVLILVFSGAE